MKVKRTITVWVLVWVCCWSSTLYGMSRPVQIVIGDMLLTKEQSQTFQREGLSYAPARLLAEALGLHVAWNGSVVLSSTDNEVIEVPKEELQVRGGMSYIPVKYAARLGGYTLTRNQEGTIIRLKNGQETQSDEAIFEAYQGIAGCDQTTVKKVYLTFDDGPNAYTAQLLDLLATYDLKATFFMIDGQMKKYPQLVKRMIDEGHGVALHGVSHDKAKFYRSATSPVGEMNRANQTLEAITKQTTKLVRMPYGSVPYLTDAQMNALHKQGYKIWDWQVDSRDWANKNGKKTYEKVIKDLEKTSEDGKVILFHDSQYTVETLTYLAQWLIDHGYTSARLSVEQQPHTFKK